MTLNQEIKLVGPGAKARLWTRSNGDTAPSPEFTSNVVQFPQELPIVLAGPVVRRVEASRAVFWLATSLELNIACIVTDTTNGSTLKKWATFTKLGKKLFINLVIVPGPIPADHLLTYNFDIGLTGKYQEEELGFEGDVLFNPSEIALSGQSLPTFFLPLPNSPKANILHGSCRKFHAPGNDATPRLQAALDSTATDLSRRPSALHLTGDQIYADDVDGGILQGLTELGKTMLGWDERMPPPDNRRVVDFGPGQRGFVLSHGFTGEPALCTNHLLGFGDYCAMYVLAWSPEIWTWYRHRVTPSYHSKAGQFASPATRKVLANVPCYMILDDHEVTDDWNLNPKWVHDTRNDPVARRIIANALAAYWAFQAIGNDPPPSPPSPPPPDGGDAQLKSAIADYSENRGANPTAFESTMLDYHRWHFTAPTIRPTIFLDTRTRRKFGPEPKGNVPGIYNPPPGLLDDTGFQLFTQALASAGGGPDDPVLVVSPAPFIGYKMAEDALKLASGVGSLYAPIQPLFDPEAWAYEPSAFAQFLRTLAQSRHKRFLILSGDVHYSYTACATCTVFDQLDHSKSSTIMIVQATASALHNVPSGLTSDALSKIVNDNDTYTLLGFTDAGRYNLLSLQELKSYTPAQPIKWDLHLRWKYLKIGATNCVLANSAGLLTFDATTVEHTAMTDTGATNQSSIAWASIPTLVPTPVSNAELMK